MQILWKLVRRQQNALAAGTNVSASSKHAQCDMVFAVYLRRSRFQEANVTGVYWLSGLTCRTKTSAESRSSAHCR